MTIEDAIRILDPETTKEELEKRCERGDYLREYEVKFYAGKLAADELRKRQWISVKGRMPEPNDRVLVYAPGMRDCDVGAIAIQSGWMCKNPNRGITHWQPMPEPPKERE